MFLGKYYNIQVHSMITLTLISHTNRVKTSFRDCLVGYVWLASYLQTVGEELIHFCVHFALKELSVIFVTQLQKQS